MKIAIMQPYLFAYLGYWQLLKEADMFVVYDDVNYIKNGWINRNYILSNGNKTLLTWPVKGISSFKKISEIELSDNKSKYKILRTIRESYSKSKYFTDVFPILEKIINNPDSNLSRYSLFMIKEICIYLGLNTEIKVSSQLEFNKELKGEERVIEICKSLDANSYINSIGGIELYSYDNFSSRGITLSFLKPNFKSYEQLKTNEFIPGLSIIDILMNNSILEVLEILGDYEVLMGEA